MYTSLFRKILVLGIIFLFAGAGTIPSVNGESWKIKTTYGEIPRASSADFGTIIVDDEGDGDYTSIQNAIENAQNGDTIKVYSGTYTENVLIDKQLTIMGVDEELGKGDDTGKPIIDGGGKGDVVIINRDASNVNFSGFMVINGGDNNKNWDSAIKIFSNNNIIYNNNISFNNLLGITLYSSSGNIISNNDFYLNEAGGLVLSINSPNNTIICNNFNKDGLLFTTWGEDIENKLSYWNSQTIEDNLVNGKPLYYYKNEKNKTVNANAGQIILVNCSNFLIFNITFTNVVAPIQLYFSSNNTISKNNISYNRQDGIALYQSFNNVITNNEIAHNKASGIFIWGSGKNVITGNTIQYNGNQSLEYADVFSLLGGIILLKNAENNLIYNNNFIQNVWWQVLDKCNNNQYDNGTVGNYWSNQWYAIDPDCDNISNIPYYVPFTSIDRYPLMNPVGMKLPYPVPIDIEIEIPKEKYLHIDNKAFRETPSGKTIIFALPWMDPLTIKVRASSKYGIEAVLVYIDFDENKSWDNIRLQHQFGNLYESNLNRNIIGTHNLTIVAHRWHNKYAVSMEIFFFYFPRRIIVG